MLKHLKIRNFAIIDAVEISFGAGLNILSGETGAGKSIVMDALFLILGGRASSNLVRAGAEEASVEALFDISEDKDLQNLLSDLGFPSEEDDLIVRRLVHSSGKNRIFINGSMANAANLALVTGRLVDLCSQHDQQLLSRPEEQLLWIDRFGNLETQRSAVKALHGVWKEKKENLQSLSSDASQRTQRIDFLRFQIQELGEANLESPTEDVEVEQELKALNNSEALASFAAEAEAALHGGDGGESTPMLDQAGMLLQKARLLSQSDAKLAPLTEHLNSLKLILDEANFFLRGYSQNLSRDEGRLESLNARGALLTKLKRKYGPTLSEVIENSSQFAVELAKLENHESSLADAEAAVAKAKADFDRAALQLSKQRSTAAKEFSASVVRELGELHMERARFEVQLSPLEEPSASGLDGAKLLIAANPGEPLQALNKVASGGELSRIMLAMHNVVSSRGGVGVFLFDEVDAGIGGKTAVVLGAKLRKVAKKNQVICITHLPQVAAFGSTHFRVEKQVTKRQGEERTSTSVVALPKEEDRILEIARMLGGSERDKAALTAAKAMLENAKAAHVKVKASTTSRGKESEASL